MGPFTFVLVLHFFKLIYENLIYLYSVEETENRGCDLLKLMQLETEPGLKSKSAQGLFFSKQQSQYQVLSLVREWGRKVSFQSKPFLCLLRSEIPEMGHV